MMFQPELWAEGNNITPSVTKMFLETYKHNLKWKKKESILEVGAGDGKCSITSLYPFIPRDYKEYLMTDVSKEMVEYIEQNVTLPNLKTAVLDVTSDNVHPEYENSFDHVFGLFLLHMLDNPRQALINIFKMLKPGGQTLLICFERTPVDEVFDKLSKHPKWGKYGSLTSGHYYAMSPEQEYKDDLAAAGFKNYVFEMKDGLKYQYKDDQEWKKIYLAVNGIIEKIPESERDEYVECYLDACIQSEGLKFVEDNGKRKAEQHLNKIFLIIATKPL